MLASVWAAIAAAIVFYALLPVAGAFTARARWHSFRSAVGKAAALPLMDAASVPRPDEPPVPARVEGRVEALGGQTGIWVRCQDCSLEVDMAAGSLFLLSQPEAARGDDKTYGATVERLRWASVASIQPGMAVLASGLVLASAASARLDPAGCNGVVVLYDGKPSDIAELSIWGGRHRNEYWNPLGQAALAFGFVLTSALASVSLGSDAPALVSALILTAALAPVLPFAPPGLAGFLLYRHFWRRARFCRAKRDLSLFRRAPDARLWSARAGRATAGSLMSLLGALAINAWLFAALLRTLL